MGLECDLGTDFSSKKNLGTFQEVHREFPGTEARFPSLAPDTLCTVSTKIGSSVLLWHLEKNSERVSSSHSPSPSPYHSLILKEAFSILVDFYYFSPEGILGLGMQDKGTSLGFPFLICKLEDCCPSLLSCCFDKHRDSKQHGEERVYLAYTSRSQSIAEETGQELKQEQRREP